MTTHAHMSVAAHLVLGFDTLVLPGIVIALGS